MNESKQTKRAVSIEVDPRRQVALVTYCVRQPRGRRLAAQFDLRDGRTVADVEAWVAQQPTLQLVRREA